MLFDELFYVSVVCVVVVCCVCVLVYFFSFFFFFYMCVFISLPFYGCVWCVNVD